MNIRGLADYNQPLVAAATVLCIGVIASVLVGSYATYRIKTAANIIEVTGSAKEAVVADFGRWTISIDTVTGTDDQQAGFNRLEEASSRIAGYLERAGFSEIETPTPNTNPNYTYPERSSPILTGYTVRRDIIVRSNNVDKLADLAGNISPLTGAGYNVTTGNLELTYQKLPEMRVKLLSGAIKDAKERAEAIAKESGQSIEGLKGATGGVVQVLSQGGVDISDYGSYDTQSKNKDVMVTVRASFYLR